MEGGRGRRDLGAALALGALASGVAGCDRACGSPTRSAPPAAPSIATAGPGGARRATGFLKGQTHLHSGNSGDSRTPPADVVRWYAARGYDFIVFTDHNRVTRAPADPGGMLVLPGVELTQNLPTCSPPEQGYTCNLHVNALFVSPSAPSAIEVTPPASGQRVDCYQLALDLTASLGGVAQLDHPNFRYGAGPALVTELARRGVRLLEIANASIDSNNPGDEAHPSTEAMWDAALTAGHDVWGVASDDAHHYDDAADARGRGETAFVGDRGWVMVRSARDPAQIRAAMERGDFYASTGVELARLEVRREAIVIEAEGRVVFRFLGPGGHVLGTAEGTSARFDLAGRRGYVRAVVTDGAGRQAWVQPVRLP